MTDLMLRTTKTYIDFIEELNAREILLDGNYTEQTRQYLKFIREREIESPGDALEEYQTYLKSQFKNEGMKANSVNILMTAAKNRTRAIVDHLEGTLPAAEINGIHRRIDKIKNIAKPQPTLSEEKIMSRDEIRKIIQGTENKTIQLMIETLANTGLRISEMLGILYKNVSANGKVRIRVIGKGSKEREVMIPLDLYNRINEHFHGEKYLFENKQGGKYNRNSITERIKKWTGKAIDRKVSAHCFRHSFATYLLNERKYNLKTVSLMLGHSSVKITADIYQSVILNANDWEGGFLEL